MVNTHGVCTMSGSCLLPSKHWECTVWTQNSTPTVIVRVTIAVMKQHVKEQLGEERVYFGL